MPNDKNTPSGDPFRFNTPSLLDSGFKLFSQVPILEINPAKSVVNQSDFFVVERYLYEVCNGSVVLRLLYDSFLSPMCESKLCS